MTSYEDWVAPLVGPIRPLQPTTSPVEINNKPTQESKCYHYSNICTCWSGYTEAKDNSTKRLEKSKFSKFTSYLRSISNLLKANKRPEISSPFNFLHCEHAGVDPVTKEIVDLPIHSPNLISVEQLTHTPDEMMTPRISTLPSKLRGQVCNREHSRRKTTIHIDANLMKQESNQMQRWSLHSNHEALSQKNSNHRPSLQPSINRKNLEISSPFNPIHVAHIAFSKDGALIAMPQSWRQSLAFEH
ncbi:hypothetical protein K7432_009974 [Basidiobolus ranarum]|uniref:CRIB domain-containing protein n=1 Tax=Basidiobolus ranarum TaxID=34480 RepID=A0ABR2WPM0_9FUNG